jgi:hypothetical protein
MPEDQGTGLTTVGLWSEGSFMLLGHLDKLQVAGHVLTWAGL